MNNVIKAAATVAFASLIAVTTGCSTIADMHAKAEDKRANPSASFIKAHENDEIFNPGMGNWGWNENNQNG